MAAPNKNGLRLRITGPDGAVQELREQAENVILGSGAQAAVRLADPRVSQLHLMLKVDKGSVVAIDLGSEGGTQVGGQRLLAPRTLAPGEVLLLGGSRVEVLLAEPEPAAEPPAPRSRELPVHLREPLPPEARPEPQARVLQVALFWQEVMLEVRHFRDGAPVVVGEGREVAFNLSSPQVGRRHVLAVSRPERLELRVPQGAGCFVTREGEVRTKESLRAEGALREEGSQQLFSLGLQDRAEVSFGELSLVLRYVRPSPLVGVPVVDESNRPFLWLTLLCLVLAGGLVAGMLSIPRSEKLSDSDMEAQRQRVAKLLVTPQRKAEIKQRLERKKGEREGAKAKEEEGKLGKEEAKKAEAEPSKPGVPTGTKREQDKRKVKEVGLLGAVSNLKGGAAQLFGPGGLGSGINDKLGGLKAGAGLGDAQGTGRGARGGGPGGGGVGLGVGGLGTKGDGPGAGGAGGLDLSGRTKTVTKIIPGKTTVVGGLDKDVIARVIRQHQNEIKYCYETELNKSPSLAGKVAVAFTIDAAGTVSEASVTESTLGSPAAESCILSRIRRWKFPEPKGGGVVAVNYPWLFSPAGADE